MERQKLEVSLTEGRRPLLLVEDEPDMADAIESELERLGYWVEVATSEETGLKAARAADPALMIVDRVLADGDSLTMVETLREEGIRVPVLFVSSLATVDERIRGLKAGGDDYLTKPFAMGELAARVEALLRRANNAETVLRAGPLELDLISRTARRGDRLLDLLPAEIKLLEYLMRRPNRTITRTMLLEDVWHYRFLPQTNLVDVHIGKLRHKMDAPGEPSLIRTLRRSGFMLDVENSF
jgi:two-component system, OmpR family, response regulator